MLPRLLLALTKRLINGNYMVRASVLNNLARNNLAIIDPIVTGTIEVLFIVFGG